MAEKIEYCVVGAGVVGSSAAYLLAREGKSVALLEQFEFAHDRGSSHGESRITRYAYDHPLYVRMAKRGFPLWSEIIAESGEELYIQTGGIDLDEIDGKGIRDCRSSLDAENISYELLDRAEIKKRFPQFELPNNYEGLYQADAGILNASLCVKTLQTLARKNGGHLADKAAVIKIEAEGDEFAITTKTQKLIAKKLLLCAGSWMGPVLHGWGVDLPLTVTQEQWAFFEAKDSAAFMPDKFPIFIEHGGEGSGGIGWYGFPIFGRNGVKSAFHQTGKVTTADTRDFEVDEKQLHELHERMQKFLPDASTNIIHAGTCLYTNSPDTHFVIDRIPDHNNAAFFTGCSGHAFKFGPVIAELLIQLVDQKQPTVDLKMFSARRFSAIKV
jgi:monomeric sarcosine oxidase